MSQEVNLLQQTKVAKREGGKLFTFSLLFLLLTVLVTVILLLYLFFLKTQEGTIINSQTESVATLSQFQDKKIIYQSTKERLAAIQQLLSTKDIQTGRFVEIAAVIPQQVEISSLDLSGNTAKMTLTSPSLSSLNEFLERNLEQLPQKEGFGVRRIQIDSLGVQSELGEYSVGITMEFN